MRLAADCDAGNRVPEFMHEDGSEEKRHLQGVDLKCKAGVISVAEKLVRNEDEEGPMNHHGDSEPSPERDSLLEKIHDRLLHAGCHGSVYSQTRASCGCPSPLHPRSAD